MAKLSETIKNSCCGTLLDVPKFDLVKRVEQMEVQNSEMKSILREILKRKDATTYIFEMHDTIEELIND